MKTITRTDFEALARVEGSCVSLYLPLTPTGRQGLGDSVRLRKALDQAEEQLLLRGCSQAALSQLMASARDLPTSDEWATRGHSLALLLGPGTQQCLPLTIDVAEEAWCDTHLHIRPLLPMVVETDRFYLLAISQNRVQMYEGNSDALLPLQLKELPQNMEDALQAEVADRATRTHPAMTSGGGRRRTTFQGQGGQPDSTKSEIAEYIGMIAEVVDSHLEGQTAPLVLATVDEIAADWRRASSYVNTLEETVGGNPDYRQPHELHEAGWEVITRSIEDSRQKSYDEACNPRQHGTVLTTLEEVLPAAILGRVETLFVDCRRPIYGEFDREYNRVEIYPAGVTGDCDLLELALRETILHRGRTYCLPQTQLAETPPAGEPHQRLAKVVLAAVRY